VDDEVVDGDHSHHAIVDVDERQPPDVTFLEDAHRHRDVGVGGEVAGGFRKSSDARMASTSVVRPRPSRVR
jgi:hypothetical protein